MICVPINVIKDKRLTNDELVAYVFLQIHTYSQNYDSCQFSIPHVVDQIKGMTKSHSMYCKTAQAIKGLIDKGVLLITQENSQCWRIFMDSFKLPVEGGFVKVDADDMRSIMDCRARGRAEILRYYLLLLAYMHPTCQRDEGWFAEQLGVSTKSIMTYNRYLQELELIKVEKSADKYGVNTYSKIDKIIDA